MKKMKTKSIQKIKWENVGRGTRAASVKFSDKYYLELVIRKEIVSETRKIYSYSLNWFIHHTIGWCESTTITKVSNLSFNRAKVIAEYVLNKCKKEFRESKKHGEFR